MRQQQKASGRHVRRQGRSAAGAETARAEQIARKIASWSGQFQQDHHCAAEGGHRGVLFLERGNGDAEGVGQCRCSGDWAGPAPAISRTWKWAAGLQKNRFLDPTWDESVRCVVQWCGGVR